VQSTTATLAAAIAAAEQQPILRVQADWAGDGYGPQGQLITNSTMESTDLSAWQTYVTGAGYTPAAGIVSAISGQVVGSVTAPAPHGGTRQMAVTWPQNAGSAGSMVGQELPTTVGQLYAVAGWVYVPASSQPVKLRAQGLADSAASVGTGSYQQLTCQFTATSPRTWVGVVLPQATTTTTFYVFVDDFTVTPVAPLDYDTISGQVRGIVIDREFVTDLPDVAQLAPVGYAAAELTVTLGDGGPGGGTGLDAPAHYSPYNTASPLFGRRLVGRPIIADIGMRGSAGPEYVRQFTGRTRSRHVVAGDRVEFSALDNSELMRGKATTLPLVVGDDASTPATSPNPLKAGLNTQWIVDQLFRQAGFYLSQPDQPNSVLYLTMHGSAWPHRGNLYAAAQYTYDALFTVVATNRLSFVPGRYGLALDLRAGQQDDTQVLLNGELGGGTRIDTNAGSHIFWEAQVYCPTQWTFNGANSGMFLHTDDAAGNSSVLIQPDAAVPPHLGVQVKRSPAVTTTLIGPTLPADGAWHYLAVDIFIISSTQVQVTVRIDGVSTVVGPNTHAAVATMGPQQQWFMDPACPYIEAVQVAAGGTFQDTFTPTATIDPGLIELNVLPDDIRDGDRWELLQTVSSAEFAAVTLDETGPPIWRNAAWWTGPAQTTVVATLTSDDALKAVEVDDAIDTVRNRITATTSRPVISPLGPAVTSPLLVLPPGLSTFTLDLGDTFAGVDGPVVALSNATGDFALLSSMFVTANADGTGGLITSGITATATVVGQIATVTVTNTLAATAYACVPPGAVPTAGSGGLRLCGWKVDTATNPTPGLVDLSDAASIAEYGEQLYDFPSSSLHQDPVSLRQALAAVLSWTRVPRPVITNVEVIGDPRRQLGDRIVLADPRGIVLGEEFWVTGVRTALDEQGFGQNLTIRQATLPGQTVLGRTGRDELGINTRL
jgi:hypothetical protein